MLSQKHRIVVVKKRPIWSLSKRDVTIIDPEKNDWYLANLQVEQIRFEVQSQSRSRRFLT